MAQADTDPTAPPSFEEEREVHDIAAALSTVAPCTVLKAVSVALLGMAAALREAAELPRPMPTSALIRRRIAEIDGALASVDLAELGPDCVVGLQQDRARLVALLASDRLE